MSFLTPLFAMGALAVALPVLFHLLRRAPQKKQTFSSLMFLSPTPPRFTRRSRISNWLLLLLRAAVLTLLAMAFTRPFFESETAVAAGGPAGQRVAVLVDTSASMRRDDLWQQAKSRVGDVLAAAGPRDEMSLTFFDRGTRSAVSFEQWNRLDPARRAAAVDTAMAAAAPTWEATAIGDAVAETAERLAADDAPGRPAFASRTVVLVSDLQQGGRPEALANRAWPDAVRLDVRPVSSKIPANAGVHVVRPPADAPADDARPRVRVATDADSAAEQFTLTWANKRGPLAAAKPHNVYVPAGRGQVVRVDLPPAATPADRLLLRGDAHDFDNTLFVARPPQQTVRIVYFGNASPDDTQGMAFYLRTVLADTPHRRIDIHFQPQGLGGGKPLTRADVEGAGLMVVTHVLAKSPRAFVGEFLQDGGDVLCVLPPAAEGGGLGGMTGVTDWPPPTEAGGNFALVARLDTTHPLLSAFADPRFGDFGRVHFWKHRRVTPPATARVLAAFDDGDPWLIEQPVGRGRLLVMTSGWQPADSQLALSPKFVPILDGLLRPRQGTIAETQLTVGDALRVPAGETTPWTLTPPDGPPVTLAAGSATPLTTPGVYGVRTAAGDTTIAVNLRPDESRTAAVSPADFTQWGAKLVDAAPSADAVATAEAERHLAQRAELESRQKIWRWLIVGALGCVAAETLLAGLLTRRAAVASPTPVEG